MRRVIRACVVMERWEGNDSIEAMTAVVVLNAAKGWSGNLIVARSPGRMYVVISCGTSATKVVAVSTGGCTTPCAVCRGV